MKADSQFNNAQIKKVVASIDHLKPMPATVIRVLKLIEDPDVSISQVAATISVDQALAARILKQANSAYYGFTTPAATLSEAVIRLGLRRIKTIIFSLTYSNLLKRRVASYNLGQGELWRHSVAVAKTSQLLAEYAGFATPDEAYLGGLLHDIGKLLLEQHFRLDWNQLLAIGQAQQCSLIEAEERLLGLNHAQVGAALAINWELPVSIVEAIAYHHTPLSANEASQQVAIVHIANTICLRLKVGLPDPVFMPDPDPEILNRLSLKDHDVAMLTNAAEMWLDRAVHLPDV